MKLHNPFASDRFIPGWCTMISLMIVFSLLVAYQPLILAGLIGIPFYISAKFILTGK